jgi:hypothetical protein
LNMRFTLAISAVLLLSVCHGVDAGHKRKQEKIKTLCPAAEVACPILGSTTYTDALKHHTSTKGEVSGVMAGAGGCTSLFLLLPFHSPIDFSSSTSALPLPSPSPSFSLPQTNASIPLPPSTRVVVARRSAKASTAQRFEAAAVSVVRRGNASSSAASRDGSRR